MGSVNIDRAKLERIMQAKAAELAARGAQSARLRVQANITKKPRVDTGAMRDSVGVRQLSATKYRVHSGTFYTMYQENGVGVIVPKKAKALRFKPKGSGTFVFAQRSSGFPAGNFFRDTVRQLDTKDFTG